jgi:hypothetical protein
MFGFSKNIWNEYQECGLVPGIAKPMCIPVRKNEKNTYKFNHRTAKVPVSMMDAYGIRENGSFVPGGLANENRRRRKAYLNNIPNAMHENNANANVNANANANANATPRFSGVPPLPPPSPQSMRENINPIVYKNAQKQQERATRTGRVSRPPLREIIRRRNRKTRRANKKTRKARKA